MGFKNCRFNGKSQGLLGQKVKIVARVINHNETIVPCVMGGYNNPLPKLFSPIKNVTFLAYNMN